MEHSDGPPVVDDRRGQDVVVFVDLAPVHSNQNARGISHENPGNRLEDEIELPMELSPLSTSSAIILA